MSPWFAALGKAGPLISNGHRQTEGRTDTYEQTVQLTQVGSKTDPHAHFPVARPFFVQRQAIR